MSNELTPETRRELYYDAMLGGDDMPADPHTREERYLEAIVEAIEAGSSDEKIQEAVNTYMEDNPEAFEEALEPIIDGSQPVGHAKVADNLTPYSEDSGTTQENPFISQGTGTDNNSVIVTTGAIARQLEKQGNTIVKNQLVGSNKPTKTISGVTFTNNNDGTVTISGTATDDIGTISVGETITQNVMFPRRGHKVLVYLGIQNVIAGFAFGVAGYTISNPKDFIFSQPDSTDWNGNIACTIANGTSINIKVRPLVIDLTQWFNGNSNIPQDLLDNPSHFSWYYNGSLAYDAGSLQNCNGRYLECGQGRQLWDEEWKAGHIVSGQEVSDGVYRLISKNYTLVVPNKPIAFYSSSGSGVTIYGYDKDLNYIGYIFDSNRSANQVNVIDVPSNCQYIKIQMYSEYGSTSSLTYNHDITISEYYTAEQGGEGYNQHYDYVAPIRIDTGNETLKAFDKKLPSGVIERNTGRVDLGTLNWSYNSTYGYCYSESLSSLIKIVLDNTKVGNLICAKYTSTSYYIQRSSEAIDKTISVNVAGGIAVLDSTYTDAETFKTAMSGVYLQYELATPTTEQGTPFSEYADINDYSYMAWFDTDGNLVSIPQGCKLFYPVDYKGFVDDLVMYTEGDATTLAKKTDIPTAPAAFLESVAGYDATKTQTLKNVEGVLTWVDDPAEP